MKRRWSGRGGSGAAAAITTVIAWTLAPVAPAVAAAPVVINITSPTTNAVYILGGSISINVAFDAPVTVTGTPQLLLETGSTDRAANYASGSGTSVLTFGYTVQSGDASNDLDIAAMSALSLNGGTIRDGSSVDAVLTVASPGTAGSLGANKDLVVDGVRPTVSIVVADDALTIGETSLVTFTFSDAVTGFTNADLTIANGTLGAVSSGDVGITWTATFTPTSSIVDATNVIAIAMSGVADVNGNAGSGSTSSNNYAIDNIRPTAGIVVADSSLTAGETALVTITFSEAVTGFTNADLTIANGTLGTVSSGNGGQTWTATLAPTTGVTDPSNVITLDNTGMQDAAGNVGSGTSSSDNYAIDTSRPTATVVVADTALDSGATTLVTITFSEAVTGFSAADLTVANGSLNALTSGNGGITWTATLTPAPSIDDATNVITLDMTGVQDAAGNPGTGSAASNNYVVDGIAPTVAITVSPGEILAGEHATVTFTFSEAVTGFAIDDVTVEHGTLGTITASGGGTALIRLQTLAGPPAANFTATFTPSAGLTVASNAITVSLAGVSDASGNPGAGATASNNFVIQTTPTVPTTTTSTTTTSTTTTISTTTISTTIAPAGGGAGGGTGTAIAGPATTVDPSAGAGSATTGPPPTVTPTTSPLPTTGGDGLRSVGLGLMLLGAGAIALVTARRRGLIGGHR